MAGNPTRRANLLSRDIRESVVVVDTRSHQAHSLDGDAAKVWRAADGQRDLAGIATHCDLDEKTVADILLQLDGLELLEASRDDVTRRALARIALAGGATAVAMPLITSLVIPAPAAGMSVSPAPESTPGTVPPSPTSSTTSPAASPNTAATAAVEAKKIRRKKSKKKCAKGKVRNKHGKCVRKAKKAKKLSRKPKRLGGFTG